MEPQQHDDDPVTHPPTIPGVQSQVRSIVQRLGRYNIDGVIGTGAMGIVYRAEDPLLQRRVAVKVLSADLSATEGVDFRERFFREARSAGQLSHPNIVTIYDVGQTNGIPYIAMEYLQGFTLRETLDSGNVLPIKKVMDIIVRVIRGLEFAHKQGVIHRDIKPSNIMLTRTGLVKILDFGIAHSSSSAKTLTDSLIGSPRYMAPEQISGEKVDARSDLFALGAVLYEMVTGKIAFDAENIPAILHKVLYLNPPAPSSINPDCPSELDATIMQALAKKPSERFANAREMGVSLVKAYRTSQPNKYVPEKPLTPHTPDFEDLSNQEAPPHQEENPPEAIAVFENTRPSIELAPVPEPRIQATTKTSNRETPKSTPKKTHHRKGYLTIGTLVLASIVASAFFVIRPEHKPKSPQIPPPPPQPTVKVADLPPPELDPVPVAQSEALPPPAPIEETNKTQASPLITETQTQAPPLPTPPPAPIEQVKTIVSKPIQTVNTNNTDKNVQAKQKMGTLPISALPWGDVYVNGTRRGASPPLTQLQLPAGRYHIVIRNADLPPFSGSVTITPGESSSISHRF